ncbi:MAG TPA: hypothetical protein VN516_03495 [Candidatus Baltobacteraceae bacterium]|nr:hypothetical protein [Candidatus Baltobacteraceae bacterium]
MEKRAPQSIVTRHFFSAKLVSSFSFAGTYRVFVERSDLVFIQFESGARSVLDVIAPFLGPFGGALVSLVLWLFKKGKARTNLKLLDEGNPEDLLRDSEKNFKLYQAEIRDAAFEPPKFFSVGGRIGRLNLLVRHGEKFRFEFETVAEMKKAIQLLAPLLNSTLKINVEWNEQEQRFEKKRNELRIGNSSRP